MKYWLMKSEPETFSIDALMQKSKQTEHWDGVRNYQARNYMKEMKKGDLVFFYHSNCKVPGIVGLVEIAKEAYPDFTAFDSQSNYFDPDSTPDKPRWYMVDVKFKQKFSEIISLEKLKNIAALENMPLVRKGNRLSVMPVSKSEWDVIINLAEEK